MATFELAGKQQQKPVAPSTRYPYKRLDSSVQKLLKVLQIDLDRLERHRTNIEKFQISKQWAQLSKEQINSSRTVKQLKATMRQLEHIRGQVAEDDIPKFDENIGDIQQKTIMSIVSFLDLQEYHQEEPLAGLKLGQNQPTAEDLNCENDDAVVPLGASVTSDISADDTAAVSTDVDPQVAALSQKQLTLELAANQQAEESWEDLRNGLMELNSLVHEFSTVVHAQQETVNRIEDNIETAHVNVQEGIFNLGSAAKLKNAMFPVAGALIGGIVGGPIGLVAGVKLGAAAAVTGGLAGIGGGQLLKMRQDSTVEKELQALQERQAERNLEHVVRQNSSSSESSVQLKE